MSFSQEVQDAVFNFTLQNAIRYDGKAQPGNIISKVLGQFPELKAQAKLLMPQIMNAVAEINAMPVQRQIELLTQRAPQMLERRVEERSLFGFLDIMPGDRVVTAFPPEPSKYPHIGHAKAAFMNYLLAKEFGGTFFLRFEDTNPELAKTEFYEIIRRNISWLGIIPDEVQYASDFMVRFYECARRLIEQGDAYVCLCSSDEIKAHREKRMGCAHRDASADENLLLWDTMLQQGGDGCLLRMRIDMAADNTTMRDPALFRIIDKPHARLGSQFRVWPTYDFQNPVMDGITGVTHRLRSKEFELRNELHRYIQQRLGFAQTKIFEFARFNMLGVESSGRVIRDKVNNGEFIGWDDPRLTTLVALERRGFQPKAIEHFVVATGITKNEATLTWDDLIVQNRKVIDATARRVFFIEDPVEVHVRGAPSFDAELHFFPNEKSGGRTFAVDGHFLLARNDVDGIADGEVVRLMDCLNFVRHGSVFEFHSRSIQEFKSVGRRIIHWLPAHVRRMNVSIMMDNLSLRDGVGEHNLEVVQEGDVIQFERFGFCRLDRIDAGVYRFWFTHK